MHKNIPKTGEFVNYSESFFADTAFLTDGTEQMRAGLICLQQTARRICQAGWKASGFFRESVQKIHCFGNFLAPAPPVSHTGCLASFLPAEIRSAGLLPGRNGKRTELAQSAAGGTAQEVLLVSREQELLALRMGKECVQFQAERENSAKKHCETCKAIQP